MDENTPNQDLIVAEKIVSQETAWGKLIHALFLDPTRVEVLIMWIFLAMLVFGVIGILRAWDRDTTNKVVLSDLVCIDGKISESKLARFGAFVISSWAFVFLIITEEMTEWFFFGYMAAWVSNAIFSKYIDTRANSTNPEK